MTPTTNAPEGVAEDHPSAVGEGSRSEGKAFPTQEVKRPVLRYHGGKWMLAPKILPYFPNHRVYTEVYGGAASILMQKPRSQAEVYNDLDGDVVDFFRILQNVKQSIRLRRLLELTPFARAEFELAYQPTDNTIESARRLIIRSFMGFGSNSSNITTGINGFRNYTDKDAKMRKACGFRTCTDRKPSQVKTTGFLSNANLSGSTPAHDWANYPKCMAAMTERLKGVVIENREATDVLRQHDSDQTLHYVDPPYVLDTRQPRSHGNYKHETTDDQHTKLASCLMDLRGMVILSGYRCPLYEKLYKGWETKDIAALADGARKRTETLWFNDLAWKRQPQGRLL